MSSGKGKYGQFFTICIVCDISKNAETVEPRRDQLEKGDFDFIE